MICMIKEEHSFDGAAIRARPQLRELENASLRAQVVPV
jgi:hypothetical protein